MFNRNLLPPMGALHAFIEAAETENFSAAGARLGLSQSAVSRQVAVVEAMAGTALFERRGRRVVLNAAGRKVYAALLPALDQIAGAMRAVRARDSELTIATLPGFGMRWLAPRLPQLSARHPDMIVNLTVRIDPFDLAREGFDAAIHFGAPDWPDADHLFLFEEEQAAVAAPDWAQVNGIVHPEDVIGAPLLFQTLRPRAWNEWLESQGIADAPPLGGARFDQFMMLAQAAQAGAGLAMVPSFLIEPELASGALVEPFAHRLKSRSAYYLVHARGAASPALSRFRDWLVDQAASDKTQSRKASNGG
ncbi:transcriptional regulator, LysR family protein [Novosphingobium nitrogenifigens DSM 19370]|uniref:Transcriptional regulator, LysR family protein n=1 Tax=Novosphingobium nitrogenifigens DSM 19370 TaxID=983920 RepID=F1ZB87_9SPHN|nr:LysR family transcriptional regulator [Novosphingobium nitrogenifigens]EGD58046.1 transcriptional regulator, LysR family protein [Novosphingobium nitrogenifigens DSM 19370]